MASFDLIKQPWIPCMMRDGQRVEFGMREALARAHEIAELRDESPLVTVALHRLLLAILHRNFGPKNMKGWKQLWDAGRFDAGALEAYFEKWRGRFDLFSETHPFYQTMGFKAKKTSSVARLAQEWARGNNSALFDHTVEESDLYMPAEQAARYLVAEQAYALGGGKSDLGNTTHGPMVSGFAVLPRGKTLFETLMLNLVVYSDEAPIPADDDSPIWECDKPRKSAMPYGYLDLLTWQSRTIRLQAEEREGRLVVESLWYAQGRAFDTGNGTREPSMAYRRDEKTGDRSVRILEDRALWRESAAIFEFARGQDAKLQFQRPGVLSMLANFVHSDLLDRRATYDISVIGLCTDKAKVNFWRHERLPMPMSLLDDEALVEALKIALGQAEQIREKLHGGVRKACWEALKAGDNDPDKQNVGRMLDGLAPERLYWPVLERPFRELIVDLADSSPDTQRLLATWVLETAAPAAKKAFDESAGRLDGSARLLRAVARGRDTLHKELNIVCKQWKEKQNEQLGG